MNRLSGILFTVFLAVWGVVGLSSCRDSKTGRVPAFYRYKVVRTYPHDRKAFTQGLAFENGFLYEGTGLHGSSTLRKVKLETGEVLQVHRLPGAFFGEGITICGDRVIQLTWKSKLGFVYDKESFRMLREFNCPTEGWGITYDGEFLIVSDGTPALRFLNPETFEEVNRVEVRENDVAISGLNELEYVNGKVYANMWPTDEIAIIAPDTGQVVGWIDMKGLLSPQDADRAVDVLNGIAYDAAEKRLFVTGKLWPKVFEIKLVRAKRSW